VIAMFRDVNDARILCLACLLICAQVWIAPARVESTDGESSWRLDSSVSTSKVALDHYKCPSAAPTGEELVDPFGDSTVYRVIVDVESLGTGHTAVYVDGERVHDSLRTGDYPAILDTFQVGTSHLIEVDAIGLGGGVGRSGIHASDGSMAEVQDFRCYCEPNSLSITSTKPNEIIKVTFTYAKQYQLQIISAILYEDGSSSYRVDSELGALSGAGWYHEGSEATFSIDRTESRTPQGEFLLAGWDEFYPAEGERHWAGTTGSVLMEHSWIIGAVWKEKVEPTTADVDAMLFPSLVMVIAVVVLVGTMMWRRRLSRPEPAKLKVRSVTSRSSVLSSKRCIGCGCALPVEARYCDACGKKQAER